jgi:hypothetical protein
VVAPISELRLRSPSDGAKSTCTPLALLGKRPQLVPAAHASVADSPVAAGSYVNIVDSNSGGSNRGGSNNGDSNTDDSSDGSKDGNNNDDNNDDNSGDNKDGNSDDNRGDGNSGGNSKLAERQL